jgi:hypothetical protein
MHTASTDLRSARASRPFASLAELSRHSLAEGSCADLQQPLRKLDVYEIAAAFASAETSGVIAKKGLGRGVGEGIERLDGASCGAHITHRFACVALATYRTKAELPISNRPSGKLMALSFSQLRASAEKSGASAKEKLGGLVALTEASAAREVVPSLRSLRSRHSLVEGAIANLLQPLRQLDGCELLAPGASAEKSGASAQKG